MFPDLTMTRTWIYELEVGHPSAEVAANMALTSRQFVDGQHEFEVAMNESSGLGGFGLYETPETTIFFHNTMARDTGTDLVPSSIHRANIDARRLRTCRIQLLHESNCQFNIYNQRTAGNHEYASHAPCTTQSWFLRSAHDYSCGHCVCSGCIDCGDLSKCAITPKSTRARLIASSLRAHLQSSGSAVQQIGRAHV